MMKMEISIKIKKADGSEEMQVVSEREVPHIEEFTAKGFREAFHDLETTILETRKEVSDKIIQKYLSGMSKKKPDQSHKTEKLKKQNTR